jgi:hypothetical protein
MSSEPDRRDAGLRVGRGSNKVKLYSVPTPSLITNAANVHMSKSLYETWRTFN